MDGVEQPKGRTSIHSLQNQPSKVVGGGGEFSPGKLRTMLEVEGVEISNLLNLKQLRHKLGKKVAAVEKEIASIRVEKEVAAMEKEVAACI
ncbi:hypothetical protein OROMI_000900 [Orobanche minor]